MLVLLHAGVKDLPELAAVRHQSVMSRGTTVNRPPKLNLKTSCAANADVGQ